MDIIRMLVGAGADVNLADNDGVTPLRVASWEGHVEAVKVL